MLRKCSGCGKSLTSDWCPWCADATAALPNIDRYQVRSLIGKGRAGAVLAAHDQVVGRDVALRVVAYAGSAERVYLEAVAEQAGWSHHGMIGIHAVLTPENDPVATAVVVMELGGSPLGQNRVKPRILADRLAGAVAALSHLHRFGRWHGGLCPGNLLIGSNNSQIADVGLRPPVDSDCSRLYSSPSLLANEEPTPADDVYALAASLWQQWAGVAPFPAADRATALGKRTTYPVGRPKFLAATLLACLHPDPRQRPHLPELAAELRGIAAPNLLFS